MIVEMESGVGREEGGQVPILKDLTCTNSSP